MPDARLKFALPPLGYSLPIAPGRGAIFRQQCQHGGDLSQRNPNSLGDSDQRDPPQHVPLVAALVARGAPAADQALTLIEVQRRDCHTATGGKLPNGELGLLRPGLLHGAGSSTRADLNHNSDRSLLADVVNSTEATSG